MELTIDQALQQGVAAHKEGKLQDAERLYQAILKSHPKHPDANHNLGLIAVAASEVDKALPLFKTALEANPKIEQFWLSYLDALIKENQWDDARKVIEQGKKQGLAEEKIKVVEAQLKSATKGEITDSAEPSQQQVNSLLEHYQAGRYDAAETLAVSLTVRFPAHPFAWKALGALLKQTGRLAEALAAMQKAVQLAPEDGEAHSNQGNTLQELGRLEEAEASCAKAIALNPNLPEAHYNLGNTHKVLARLDEAEASYKKAIDLKPDYAEAYSNLGVTLYELGKLNEAEACYAKAIALKPNFAEAHHNLGNTLQELRRLDEAEVSYRKSIALKPGFTQAHSNLGSLLLAMGRHSEGLKEKVEGGGLIAFNLSSGWSLL